MNRAQLKELVKNIMGEESEYQTFFQKALEKAGKSIPSMSDDEKKAFFNKIDSTWDGKGEKNEGNAFGAAVTAAKKAGEDEFEVGGETYKVEEELVGGQKKLDVDKDGEIEASDLAALRAGKKADEAIELPSATIPSAIKSKLMMAIDKIKDSNLTYNQKIQVVGQVMDSLGIDNAEFNKMASKLKGTMESVITESINEADTVKNPKTGKDIKVSTALAYGKSHPAYKAASAAAGDKAAGTKPPMPPLPKAAGTKPPMPPIPGVKPPLRTPPPPVKLPASAAPTGAKPPMPPLPKAAGTKPPMPPIPGAKPPLRTPPPPPPPLPKAVGTKPPMPPIPGTKPPVIVPPVKTPTAPKAAGTKPPVIVPPVKTPTAKNSWDGYEEPEFAKGKSSWDGAGSWDNYEEPEIAKGPSSWDKKKKESVNEGVSPKDMDAIKSAVEAASSFMGVGSELKKLGMKYTFATEPLPIYIIQPTPNNKVAIVNKKYATKPDFVHGDIAVGVMEGKTVKSVTEGRAFINAARKAKTEGLTEFEFNGKKYPVTIKD